MPNEIFKDEDLNVNSLRKFSIFFDYLIEHYDNIICSTFITGNFLSKILVNYSSISIHIPDIEQLNEEVIISKVKLI